jgi:amino acid transporter
LGKQTTRDYGAPAQLMTEVLPRPMAFCIILLLVVLMQFQDIAQLLASSRFIWALARDSAIPFSPWLGRLSTARIPVRATWAVCGIAGPALLLVAASRKIVTSLVLQGCGSSLVLAYLIPVICYLTCGRGALDSDGRNEWTLRGWSKPLALFGSTYVLLIITLMLCPNTAPVTACESGCVCLERRLMMA